MTTDVRRWAFAAATLAVVTGCGSSAKPEIAWQEPARYSFVVDSRCGERGLIGRFRVTVDQGRVTRTENLDEPGGASTVTSPSLRELLAEVWGAQQAHVDVAVVTTDPADGHPTRITIDDHDSIDEEACYVITDYAAR
jgi:hypothetical protein